MKNKSVAKKISIKLENFFFNTYEYLFCREILYGFNFFLYRISLKGMGITIDTDGKKNGEVRFLRNFLSKCENPIIFDIGANIGNYSAYILSSKTDAKVYAFEPHPLNYEKLLKLKNQYKNINTFNLGLSNEKGNSLIYDYANKDGSPKASLYKDVIEMQYDSPSVYHEIKMITIDDFVNDSNIDRIDLLKIDTEGHELEILKGAKNSLMKGIIGTIQFEFNYTNIINAN